MESKYESNVGVDIQQLNMVEDDTAEPTPPGAVKKDERDWSARLLECFGRTKASTSARVIHSNAPEKNAGYVDNRIKNTKYTVINFLPKNAIEQFRLHMNRYFLFIAILQLFSELTPVNPLSTWIPLLLIFAISAAREGVDDYRRWREDTKANDRPYTVYRNGHAVNITSKDILVGDIVHLVDGQEVPCDLVLLHCPQPRGNVFVMTTNLDGETALKTRTVPKELLEKGLNDMQNFQGVVECAAPNADVYKFDSRLWLEPSLGQGVPDSNPVPLTGDNFLQQTIKIQNTGFILGVAVYTGNETKFGMNQGDPPSKLTKSDKLVNKLSIFVFLFQLAVVFILGILGDVVRFDKAPDTMWYVSYGGNGPWYEFLIIPLRFLLLNSTMIPISLKVTLDLCKLLYSYFIAHDALMYDAETEQGVIPRSTSICENLGQIEFVLTDKTGTLTQNNMVFDQCCIGNVAFSTEDCKPGGRLEKALQARDPEAIMLFKNFALNNSVVPVRNKETGKIVYKGASPDEVALVEAGARMGIVLLEREGPNISISEFETLEKYVILDELAFSPDRRRMSVVVLKVDDGRDGLFSQKKKLSLFCKGGDDVLLERLRPDQNPTIVRRQVDELGAKGLRTLVYGFRDLPEDEYTQWSQELREARRVLENREDAVNRVYDMLERDFLVQGCTAIEDKLQEEVPETIALLRRAGIKFWMLTGDRTSTAKQIAIACNLRSAPERTYMAEIEGVDEFAVGESLVQHLAYARKRDPNMKEVVVVAKGSTLQICLEKHAPPFTQLCGLAHTVICCRVSPSQKADLVRLVRNEYKKTTLAIGDGGNDVAMIQAADVGVGIRGREGLQASRASDYSVGTFGALKRLLLIHGRYSYMRTGLVVQYSFYKSVLFCCLQIGFSFVSAFSGATLFNSLCITAYNVFLFVPIVSFVLDRDISFHMVLKYPHLYLDSVQSRSFNWISFGVWMLRAFLQALAIFITVTQSRGIHYHNEHDGSPSDWETLGIVAFCAYLWIQTCTMLLELRSITWVNVGIILFFHGLTLMILGATSENINLDSFNGYGIVAQAWGDSECWLDNFFLLILCILPVVFCKSIMMHDFPSERDKLRVLDIRNDAAVSDLCVSTLLGASFLSLGAVTRVGSRLCRGENMARQRRRNAS